MPSIKPASTSVEHVIFFFSLYTFPHPSPSPSLPPSFSLSLSLCSTSLLPFSLIFHNIKLTSSIVEHAILLALFFHYAFASCSIFFFSFSFSPFPLLVSALSVTSYLTVFHSCSRSFLSRILHLSPKIKETTQTRNFPLSLSSFLLVSFAFFLSHPFLHV